MLMTKSQPNSAPQPTQKTALILSGGGARGAYQVGVLKGLSEILKLKNDQFPFQIISGTSAGAINAAHLACQTSSFGLAVERLVYLWAQLTPDQVFKVRLLGSSGFSLKSLAGFSDVMGGKNFNAILDTSPLAELLKNQCKFENLSENLKNGRFETVLITANNYLKNKAESFVQSRKHSSLGVNGEKGFFWSETRRLAVEADLGIEHIMASSAIPLLFPPIKIKNDVYGDGCVRNHTPCSPSIRVGAEKLFVVGVRTQKNMEFSSEASNLSSKEATDSKDKQPTDISLIRILNTLLNAVLLDSVEQDVQRIQRINELVELAQRAEKLAGLPTAQTNSLKKIPALCISPSGNIGEIARSQAHHLPRLLRMTIGAFGDLDDASEILSYLMFEKNFCRRLIEMGYHDAYENRDAIESFFSEDNSSTASEVGA